MKRLSWPEVRKLRLTRNYLDTPAPKSKLVEVVGRVGGIQAQILSAAELALGVRVRGLTQKQVSAELWERRRLVKTYGPRGTLHLLPAGELPFWMAAMQAREALQEKPWYSTSGLSAKQSEKLLHGIGTALDGRCLTRAELAREVAQKIGSWAKALLTSTWGEMMGPAAYAGLLCFGPSQGSKVTFVRADRWIPTWQVCDPQQSLIGVLRRYIGTYGPVTAQDFARWFWMKPKVVESLLSELSPELEPVEREGESAWLLAGAGQVPNGDSPSVRLIPQYDCYILGSNPRDSIVPETAKARIFSYGRGRLEGAVGLPLVLCDGQVAGIWDRHRKGKRLVARIELFTKFNPDQIQVLEFQTQRLGEFLEIESVLEFGSLT